jgi:hypothetical protein
VTSLLEKANTVCGIVRNTILDDRNYQPTQEGFRLDRENIYAALELLKRAAEGKVTFVEPSRYNPAGKFEALPKQLEQVLDRVFPRGYINGSNQRESLILFSQKKLIESGWSSITLDDKLGRETAQALLRQFEKDGLIKPGCF